MGMEACAYTTLIMSVVEDRQILGVHWPTSLSKMAISKFSEMSTLKNKMEKNVINTYTHKKKD